MEDEEAVKRRRPEGMPPRYVAQSTTRYVVRPCDDTMDDADGTRRPIRTWDVVEVSAAGERVVANYDTRAAARDEAMGRGYAALPDLSVALASVGPAGPAGSAPSRTVKRRRPEGMPPRYVAQYLVEIELPDTALATDQATAERETGKDVLRALRDLETHGAGLPSAPRVWIAGGNSGGWTGDLTDVATGRKL